MNQKVRNYFTNLKCTCYLFFLSKLICEPTMQISFYLHILDLWYCVRPGYTGSFIDESPVIKPWSISIYIATICCFLIFVIRTLWTEITGVENTKICKFLLFWLTFVFDIWNKESNITSLRKYCQHVRWKLQRFRSPVSRHFLIDFS